MQAAKRNLSEHLPVISIYGYVGGRQTLSVMGVRKGVPNFFFDQLTRPIGRHRFGRFVGVRVGVVYSRKNLRCVQGVRLG